MYLCFKVQIGVGNKYNHFQFLLAQESGANKLGTEEDKWWVWGGVYKYRSIGNKEKF
jgi:hypothetical protein